MPSIKLRLKEKKDIFLYTTKVENLFINEYLPDAPGEYVKVYLFGLMNAQFEQKMDTRMLAMQLGLTEDEVEEAWIYWESRELVRRLRERNSNNEETEVIEFFSLIENLYGKAEESFEPVGTEAAGIEAAIGNTGIEAAGSESAGVEYAGTEYNGAEYAGNEIKGIKAAGTGSTGSGNVRTGSAGRYGDPQAGSRQDGIMSQDFRRGNSARKDAMPTEAGKAASGASLNKVSSSEKGESPYPYSNSASRDRSASEAGEDTELNAAAELPLYVSIDDTDFDDILAEKMIDKNLQKLHQKFQAAAGRTISRREITRISDAVKVYGVVPEVMSFAIDYCADLGKDSVDYLYTVALRWTEEGCRTVDDVQALLEKHSLRNSWYSKVFKSLGLNRLAIPAERELMNRWFDEMNCTIGEVLDACAAAAGTRDPNLRYVNKVLENRMLEKGGATNKGASGAPADGRSSGSVLTDGGSLVSRRVLSDYYEYIRNEEEQAQKQRIAEVKARVPEIAELFKAESEINSRMLSIKPGEGSLDMRQKLRTDRIRIDNAKKDLLDFNGFPRDYLNRRYRCSKCGDTGYTDEGMVCSCAKARADEAYEWISGNAVKRRTQ